MPRPETVSGDQQRLRHLPDEERDDQWHLEVPLLPHFQVPRRQELWLRQLRVVHARRAQIKQRVKDLR